MSYKTPLEKIRTIRLSSETDQRIEARAAEKGRTASELIRDALEAEFSDEERTPGQWLLESVQGPPDRKPDAAFAAAYRRRHR